MLWQRERYQSLRDDFNNRAVAEQAEAEAENLLVFIEGVALLFPEDPMVEVQDRDGVDLDLSRLMCASRRMWRRCDVWQFSTIRGRSGKRRRDCQSAILSRPGNSCWLEVVAKLGEPHTSPRAKPQPRELPLCPPLFGKTPDGI
jgi:hypothetical protein